MTVVSLFAIRTPTCPIALLHSRVTGNRSRIYIATALVLLNVSGNALAQTTRTTSSTSATTSTIPSSSPTSANSPCNAANPTSSCYSTRAPRLPCYSATGPDDRCADVTTPSTPTENLKPPPVSSPNERAITEDQAIAKIQAQGFSKVSKLQKDRQGIWRGNAEKDGRALSVILRPNGDITTN